MWLNWMAGYAMAPRTTSKGCVTSADKASSKQHVSRPNRSTRAQPGSARGQNLRERAQLDLTRSQTSLFDVTEVDCAAVECAQKIVEQPLTGRRIVEHFTDQRGLRCLFDEVLQPFASAGQALEEERIAGGVAGGQLPGMQIPTLVEATLQRVADVTMGELPRSVDCRAILFQLLGRERATAVRGHGHHVGGSIRQEHPGSGIGEQHQALCQVAHRV